MFHILLTLFCVLNTFCSEVIGKRVIFINPVTELSRNLPLPTHDGASFKGEKSMLFRRAYQALYGDTATIVHVKGDAYLLKLDKVIYDYDRDGQSLDQLWAPQSAVRIITDESFNTNSVIILQKPWRHETGVLYSAATHFALARKSTDAYTIRLYHPITRQEITVEIPHDYAIRAGQHTSLSAGKRLIAAARSLIEMAKPGVVPFVWGGCSFCAPCLSDITLDSRNNWVFEHEGLYNGLDGGSLVFFCAKMADIYYPWKTTFAAFKGAPELRRDETIMPGDIICFAGCEAIIASDTTVIYITGYELGSGALEEVAMQQLLRNADTINDLQYLFTHFLPLQVATRSTEVTEWKIIRPSTRA